MSYGNVHHHTSEHHVVRRHTTHKMLEIDYVDLVILFKRAAGLPKMDRSGYADPYFVANLDGKVTFV